MDEFVYFNFQIVGPFEDGIIFKGFDRVASITRKQSEDVRLLVSHADKALFLFSTLATHLNTKSVPVRVREYHAKRERLDLSFLESWPSEYIQTGSEDALVELVVVMDPVSRDAQRLLPTLVVCIS